MRRSFAEAPCKYDGGLVGKKRIFLRSFDYLEPKRRQLEIMS